MAKDLCGGKKNKIFHQMMMDIVKELQHVKKN
jgi:hypothetical protein